MSRFRTLYLVLKATAPSPSLGELSQLWGLMDECRHIEPAIHRQLQTSRNSEWRNLVVLATGALLPELQEDW